MSAGKRDSILISTCEFQDYFRLYVVASSDRNEVVRLPFQHLKSTEENHHLAAMALLAQRADEYKDFTLVSKQIDDSFFTHEVICP